MNLVIDIGNTRTKCALFEGDTLKQDFVIGKEAGLPADLNAGSFTRVIAGTVLNELPFFVEKLKEDHQVMVFTSATPVPLKNIYKSAATLGSDRLAAAVGANYLFPGIATLAIDAGTCIKYNFTSAEGEYTGGAISPGLQMRFKALNTFTARLPLLESDDDFEALVGNDTRGSILSGVQGGAVAEMDGIIDRYRQLYPGIKVLLTGGDNAFFAKRLKNSIFADPFLVLRGLNLILNHNAH